MVLLLYLANDKVNGVAKSVYADKSTLVVILDNLYHQVEVKFESPLMQ